MRRLCSLSRFAGGRTSRRELLQVGALAAGGLTLSRFLQLRALAAAPATAQRCIFVFLNGGASQLDTFDMKPAAPAGIRGPYQPIATSVAGTQITEKLPRLAQLAHKYAIVRSAHHHLLAHNSGAAYALSGHSPGTDQDISPKPTDHPAMGSVVSKLQPTTNGLPGFVLTPTLLFDMGFPTPSAGGGWLGSKYDAFPVVRNRMMSRSPPWEGKLPIPEGLRLPAEVSFDRLSARDSLLSSVDSAFASAHRRASLQTLNTHQQHAMDLILSPKSRAAFDLAQEPSEVHDRYGRHEMGQVLLLARRLIEGGVRFVTANAVSNPPDTKLSAFQIWDTHFDHFRLYDSHLLPELDQSLSALLEDLDQRRLLDDTLVIVMGEFGRTPTINSAPGGGRDHWSKAYSLLFAGGGVRGGAVYGATDAHAAEVRDRPVRPDDLSATVFSALGITPDQMLPDMRGRPHRISDGEPITALFG